MKITLDIPDEVLARIWDDTWRDKDERPIAERVKQAVFDKAAVHRLNFPSLCPNLLVMDFHNSEAVKKEGGAS